MQGLPGGTLKQITASTTGNMLWAVNDAGSIYYCGKPCLNGPWQQADGSLVEVDADANYVYGVNRNDEIYFRPLDNSGRWSNARPSHPRVRRWSGIHLGSEPLSASSAAKSPSV